MLNGTGYRARGINREKSRGNRKSNFNRERRCSRGRTACRDGAVFYG